MTRDEVIAFLTELYQETGDYTRKQQLGDAIDYINTTPEWPLAVYGTVRHTNVSGTYLITRTEP